MIVRCLKILLLILALGASALFLHARMELGQFAALEPPTPQPVTPLTRANGRPVEGAEDIVIDRVHRVLYLSAYDRRAVRVGKEPRGALYAVSLDDPALVARDVTPPEPALFHPHGLSLTRDDAGAISLYVINHPGTFDDVVEIFDVVDDGSLHHRETIADSGFVSLNDLAVVGPRRFYASNDHGHRAGFRRKLEDAVHTRESSVVYFDGSVASPVATQLNLANGIGLSPDGRVVYVAELLSRRISVFGRDAASGNLRFVRTIPMGSGVDNIDVDEDGSLWVGAHPKVNLVRAFAADPAHPSPSQVLHVDVTTMLHPVVRTVFLDDGQRLNSSTVAVHDGNRIFVGSAFGPAAMVTLAESAATGP